MFITAVALWIYFIIGLVWTIHTVIAIGDFFKCDDFGEKLDRIASVLISVVLWPCTLLVPWFEGFTEARNERKSKTL